MVNRLVTPVRSLAGKRWLTAAAAVGALAVLSGCAHQSASSNVYTYSQAQREQIVRLGTVQSVRPIVIQSDRNSGVGMVGGGALGGVAGSAIGGGTGRALATVGGALLGGLIGDRVEHEVNKTQGLEIIVQLDNGESRVITQAADVAIRVGQRVRIISGGGGPARVVPM